MAKNFEEKTLIERVKSFVKQSNDHAKLRTQVFSDILAYTLRTGRREVINDMWREMTNGADKAAFVSGLTRIGTLTMGVAKLLSEQDANEIKALAGDKATVVRMLKIDPADKENLIKLVSKDDDENAGAIYRQKLVKVYGDDESLSAAVADIFDKEDKAVGERATQGFNAVAAIKRLINSVAEKMPEAEGKKLALDLDKVIRGNFGSKEALGDSGVAEIIKEKHSKDDKRLQEALEIAKKHGYEIKAKAPEIVAGTDTANKVETGDPRKKSA